MPFLVIVEHRASLTGKSMTRDSILLTDPSGVFACTAPDCIEAFATDPTHPLECSRASGVCSGMPQVMLLIALKSSSGDASICHWVVVPFNGSGSDCSATDVATVSN